MQAAHVVERDRLVRMPDRLLEGEGLPAVVEGALQPAGGLVHEGEVVEGHRLAVHLLQLLE